MLRSITDRFTAIFRPSNGANGSDLNTDEASQTVDREQAIRDFESPAIARSTLYFGPHFVVKQGNGRNGNGYASANAALMNELLQNAQNTAAMTAGMLNVWENTRRRQQNGSLTEIQTTSTTLHSLVNIRKSSLRLSPVSSPTAIDSPQGLTVNTKLREPNQLYNLEFIFDSSVDCRITVHWLVTETWESEKTDGERGKENDMERTKGKVKPVYVPRYPSPISVGTYTFSKGLAQKFSLDPSAYLDFSVLPRHEFVPIDVHSPVKTVSSPNEVVNGAEDRTGEESRARTISMSVNSAASHSYSLGSANEHNGLLASQNSGTITGNLNRRNLVPGTIPEGQIGTDIGGDESAYGAQLNRDTRITINPTDGERNSTPNEATENQAASPLQQGLELTAKKNGLYPLVIVIEAIPKPSHILMDNSRVTRKDEGKNKVDTQTTFASLVYTGEGTFDIKVLKQKIMIDGSSYVLQEIYGFSETASRLDAPLSNTAAGDNKNTTPECVVCMADPKDTIVLPCRHLCLCKDCADQLRKQSQKCPICRQDFHSLLHIKLPKTNKPPTLARNTASISPPSNPSNIIPDTVIPNVDNETAANAQPIHPSAPPFDYHTELPVPINQAPPELNEIPPSIAPLNYDSNCNINTENTVNADQREDGVENAGAQFSSATENMESKPDDKS